MGVVAPAAARSPVATPGVAEAAVPGTRSDSATVSEDLGAVLAVLCTLEDRGIRLYSLRWPLRYQCRARGAPLESLVAARYAGPKGARICPSCFYRHVTGSR
jgi:hypothetical protein